MRLIASPPLGFPLSEDPTYLQLVKNSMFCWKGKFTSKFCIISDSQEKGGLRLKGFESRRQLVAPVTLRGLREVPGGDGHGVRLVGGGAPPWFLTLCPGWNPAQWWCGWDES